MTAVTVSLSADEIEPYGLEPIRLVHRPGLYVGLFGDRDSLIRLAERLLDVAVGLGKVDAAGVSPNARPVSPVSATVSPDGGAPGLVSTLAEGGSGGAPGAPADCAPVPAPNIDINTDPKEGEL